MATERDMGSARWSWILPAIFALFALGAFVVWLRSSPGTVPLRIPGTDRGPGSELGTNANAVLAGRLIPGEGQPGKGGNWPQFRGPGRDGVAVEHSGITPNWPGNAPKEVWNLDVGEGYAGPAVVEGRVYLMDYDRETKQDALRCLSLQDGREIWRYAYPVAVKRNHGMSRTVPAVSGNVVVAMGPKCHVLALNATTGDLRWGLDLVRRYGTTVPPWYAGQCPLIEGETVILAPGGRDSLLVGLELQTGNELWRTPNPRLWKMTHSSIMPLEFEGERMYVYCANKGAVGVSAKDGRLLWETEEWKISIATVPSPVILNNGRIFFSGGYNAGSLLLELKKDGGNITPRTVMRLAPGVFGATQQTPILYGDHLYGVRADGKFVCLDLEGKIKWTSASGQPFGLGPFLITDGFIYSVNDSGLLRVIEARPDVYKLAAQAQILNGRESWGPLALANGRLIARDLTRMVCLDLKAP